MITYALLLTSGVLAMSELISNGTRALLGVVGIFQVALLIHWTLSSDCVGTWCAQSGGISTWLFGPALLSFTLGFAAAEARRARRAAGD
jgi:hypothetical protein